MARQTSTKALPMSSTQLHRLEAALRNACDEMEALQIPDSLVHNDMNSGNILFDGTRALFIDWAEGFVGNPFFTFQHLLAYALSLDQTQSLGASLTKLYTMHWREHLGDRAITRALALAAPLAIASYVIGRDTCTLANNRRDGRVESYTRSLARHMYRATRAPEFLEALCH
jgi:aminoglycoside phosphotransferase (APT) family kinase protein